MGKFVWLALALFVAAVLGLRNRLPSGLGVQVLSSEKTFDAGIQSSLVQLDRAKGAWARVELKSDTDVPTIRELRPYLGKWTNGIEKFESLGVNYRITSVENNQSDVGVLTRNVYFQAGISRFYPTGTQIGLMAGFRFPNNFKTPVIVLIREFLIENPVSITVTIGVAILFGSAVSFLTRKRKKEAH